MVGGERKKHRKIESGLRLERKAMDGGEKKDRKIESGLQRL